MERRHGPRLRIFLYKLHWIQVNFEQEIRQLQDTKAVMADIQRQQAEVQQLQAKHLAQHEQRLHEQAESMRVHEQRMAHVDMRLAEITDKLDGLIGFMGGFKGPQ